MANFTDQVALAYKLYERGEYLKAHQLAVDLYVQNEIPELSFLIGLIRFENKCPLPRGYAELWMNFILESANEGYDPACQFLGNAYYSGNKVPKDYGKAFNWYTKAANKGDPFSYYMLGEMYSYGRYVNYDQALADKYYEKSALLGCYDAQKLLAERCFYIDKKYNVAERLYKLLAQNQSAPLKERVKAQSNLAFLYRGNNGFIKDDAKARYYSGLALKNGEKQEAIHYASACFKGEGGPKDYKEAIYGYKILAEKGEPVGWAYLGLIYNNGGYGCTADYDMAFKCYDKGAELGVASCYLALARYYFWGRAVSKDYNTAIFWCNKAVAKNVNGATELLKEINDTINKEEKEKREQKEKEDRERREKEEREKRAREEKARLEREEKARLEREEKARHEREERERREREERERQLAEQKEREEREKKEREKLEEKPVKQDFTGKTFEEVLASTKMPFNQFEKNIMKGAVKYLDSIRAINYDQVPLSSYDNMYQILKDAYSGDAIKQNIAGEYYENGYLEDADYHRALYWYLKAADQGEIYSMYRIAMMLYNGNGIPKSSVYYLAYLCMSAMYSQKCRFILHIGRAYFGNKGIDKDIERAKFWGSVAEKWIANESDASDVEWYNNELKYYE